MRVVALCLAVSVLAGCQMQMAEEASVAKESVSGTGDGPADSAAPTVPDAEAELAAAFDAAAATLDAPPPKKKGLFARLAPAVEPAPSPLDGTDIEVVEGTKPDTTLAAIPQSAAQADTAAADAPENAPGAVALQAQPRVQTAGLFGLFTPRRPKAAAPAAALPEQVEPTALPAQEVGDETDIAAAPDAAENIEDGADTAAPAPKKGLFARLAASAPRDAQKKAPRRTASTVAPGETVAFGVVGITCETRKSEMGTQVDQYPRNGRAIWRLYDTAPSSTGPRTQYITGFSDGCARQITGALVVFGSPDVHETHRYSKANKASWSEADNRYETIKTKYCGVAKKAYCPADRLSKLGNDLAFVSVYPRFGGYDRWLELLLHKGRLDTQQLR